MNEMSGDNVDGTTNIIPKMGLEVLREGYKKLLGSTLFAPALLRARQDLSPGIQNTGDQCAPGAAVYSGVLPIHLPAGHPGR